MELNKAEQLANELMREHNLSSWTFKFNSRKRSLGLCSYNKRTIYLSKVLVPLMIDADVKDTILHEIAHALVGRKHGHDYVWKSKAREIGCKGERCGSDKIDSSKIDAKYKAECVKCGMVYPLHRKSKRRFWCKCTNKTFKEAEVLNFIQQY